ncbi:MAG: NAD(P)/FAD-dependent oxidoreductase [bacterium]
MPDKYQIVVAGAGPGGCIFARDLARAGLDVVVFEKQNRDALGHNWSDAVERIALQAIGIDVPAEDTVNRGPLVKKAGMEGRPSAIFEEHAYPDMEVWAPDYCCKKEIQFRYITTDRRALAQLLVDQAMAAGVTFRFRQEVIAPVTAGGSSLSEISVTGIEVRDLDTHLTTTVSASVTADDTGFASVLRTALPVETGIARPFTEDEFALVHRTVRKRDPSKIAGDRITDHYRYPYRTGYQWVQTLNEEEIDIGAGIKFNADTQGPQETVERFIARHPSITGTVVRGGGGRCLVGRSPYSLVAGGFVIIGDAGSQTIPMTGCGAGGAMIGGKLAAKAVIRAAAEGKTDIAALWPYNLDWVVGSGRGANYAALTALRSILQKLPEESNAFLFKKDVFSGEMLTQSINGLFQAPTLPLMVKTFVRCLTRPGLLMQLNKATTLGTALYKHYQRYPANWNPDIFQQWCRTSDRLFSKAE